MKAFKAIAAAALMSLCSLASAQTLEVKDFQLLKKDKTACSKATAKKDANGKKYAVIKITIDGQKEAVATDAPVTETQGLAYVRAGEKSIMVSDPATNAITEYTFPVKIKKGKTYRMELVSTPGTRNLEPEPKPEVAAPVVVPDQQFVLFLVEPANAVVEFNNETLFTKNGVAQKLNDVGEFEYTVSAKGYYPVNGKVTICAKQKSEVSVSLRPADGWVYVSDNGNEDLTGADIYVDGELQGKAPLKMGPFTGGSHKVLVAKESYSNFSSEIFVIDNDTVKVSPCLNPNFAVVNVVCKDKDAEIWANGVKLGKGCYTGKLPAGVYAFESREIGYTSAAITAEVKPQAEVISIEVPSPDPVYGKIIVTTYPAKAIVKIDGVIVGETPLYLPEVKYGKYEVEIFKCGYKPFHETVQMNESMRINVTADLEKCCEKAEEHCQECASVAEPVCEKPCCEKKAEEHVCKEACCEKAEEPKHECCGKCKEEGAEPCPDCKKAAETAACPECAEKTEAPACPECAEKAEAPTCPECKKAEEKAECPACAE